MAKVAEAVSSINLMEIKSNLISNNIPFAYRNIYENEENCLRTTINWALLNSQFQQESICMGRDTTSMA